MPSGTKCTLFTKGSPRGNDFAPCWARAGSRNATARPIPVSSSNCSLNVRIPGGKLIKPENPCYIKLANTWIILNSGGGPTPDKPEVLLETPSNLNRVNSFLDLRVADIWACYKQWGDKGAFFLTEPLDNHGWEWRCYMRDPDGYLIEVGQYTQMALDWFTNCAT